MTQMLSLIVTYLLLKNDASGSKAGVSKLRPAKGFNSAIETLFKTPKQMYSSVFLRASHLSLFILIASSIGDSEEGHDYLFFLKITTFSGNITRGPTLPTVA